ncbi:MAG TPA: ABC transporter substrate-binding protein [Streptosporangiaceae bacterium]|jgi:peptide/nickel transport system substrate-binding protein
MHLTYRTRLLAAAVGVTLGAGALASCASDPTRGAGGGATLNMYLYQKPKLFSPLAPPNGPDQLVMSFVLDSLYGADANYQLTPHLAAAAPKVSADARTFTFKLRTGLKWSDGKPFTAKDVVFSFNAMANPATGSAQAGRFADVTGASKVADGKADTVSGITALDGTTVRVTTDEPDAGLPALIGMLPLMPAHILGKVPAKKLGDDAFFTAPTVGTGAFRFVTYKTDQYVELAANPNFRTPVAVKKVFLKPVTSDVATGQLGTGEMDLAQLSPTDLPSVRKQQNITVTSAHSPGFNRIAFNQTQERFDDPRVRQAFLVAVDRKTLVAKVLAGEGFVPNTSFYGDAVPSGLDPYGYDPNRAKRLLKQAGWDFSKPVTLTWVPGQRDRDTAATVVQSQLEAVGVKVKLKQVQAAELTDSYTKKSFDLAMFGGGNYATDPWSVDAIDACDQAFPAGGNVGHFCDAGLDKLMRRANGIADPAQRLSVYKQAAKVENRQVPYLWLYNPNTIWANSSRLTGFRPNGTFTNEVGFWDPAAWKLG